MLSLRRAAALLALTLLPAAACSAPADSPPPAPEGPLAAQARRVAREQGLPPDLLLAVGAVEGGLSLPRFREVDEDDEVPVAGITELRRGAFDSLAHGARLLGVSEADLRADTDLGTEAAAQVLRERREVAGLSESGQHDLPSWRGVIGELSGHREPARRADYVARVFQVLRAGGSFRARGGETVVIAPHPEIPVGLTLAPPGRLPQGTPESPLVTEWVDTPSSGPAAPGSTCVNKWDTSNDSKQFIAIHDTEGGWDASLATLQNDGCKSVQYMVDADGSRVAQFIPEKTVAYHLGNYHYNQLAIGIEHVGKASDPAGYKRALYDKSAALVKDISSRWSIPLDRDHIWGHYQVPNGNAISSSSPPCGDGLDACEKSDSYGGANNHRDPGYNWQWCQYLELIGGSCRCNDAWPLWNCTTDGTEMWRCNSGTLEKQTCAAGCLPQPTGTPDQCAPDPGGQGGGAGSGQAGSGQAGSGQAGSGQAGSGQAGSGTAGSGTAGSGTAGSGTAGSDQAGGAGGESAGGSAGGQVGGPAGSGNAGQQAAGGQAGAAGRATTTTVVMVPTTASSGSCAIESGQIGAKRPGPAVGLALGLLAVLRRTARRRHKR
jgi:hypothetical protein